MMFFMNIFLNIYIFLKSLFSIKDYTVSKVEMTYTSPPCPAAAYSDFWKSEERYWDTEESRNWTIVTDRVRNMGETPEGVKDLLFTIKYYYDGKRYRMITRDRDYVWPPKEPSAHFRVPIRSALLMDKDKPVMNVTKKLLKVMGPRRDFHNQDVAVEDLFMFTDYSDIRVTDILNNAVVVPKTSSCLRIL